MFVVHEIGVGNGEYRVSSISREMRVLNREYGKHSIFIEIVDFREN